MRESCLTKYASAIRLKHYSYRTEETYVKLNSPFHLVSQQASPAGVGHGRSHGVTHLAVTERVAASTQNQALNAILFFYRVVLQQELVGIDRESIGVWERSLS